MGIVDRIAEAWGTRTAYGSGEDWPSRKDSFLEQGLTPEQVDRWVQTASLLHSNGDAMDIAVKDGRIVGVRRRAGDRVNRGRLGPKDLFGWQANGSADRLTTPLVRRNGYLLETDWDDAMAAVAERTRAILDERGPSSIAFYTTGQLFLEEYYALALIARGGTGTNHLDGNTWLCTATVAAALKQSFGSHGQPGSYRDIDDADVICLYGHNMAETQTVLWARVLDRLSGPQPPRIVCVDPRRTAVAEHATVHVAARPGTNVMMMNALLRELIEHDQLDRDHVERHTVGLDELARTVAPYTPERASEICDVPVEG
jgi:anaerobic selenocysteine-containing dehydrogenase